MFVVDTNILIYAASKDSPRFERARDLLENWRSEESVWHSTWGIFYEFLRITTHSQVLRNPLTEHQAWSFLGTLDASPGFSLLVHTENHSKILFKLMSETSNLSGNIWHDAHIVALMKDHGIKEIVTADTDFHRFGGIKVTNPFR